MFVFVNFMLFALLILTAVWSQVQLTLEGSYNSKKLVEVKEVAEYLFSVHSHNLEDYSNAEAVALDKGIQAVIVPYYYSGYSGDYIINAIRPPVNVNPYSILNIFTADDITNYYYEYFMSLIYDINGNNGAVGGELHQIFYPDGDLNKGLAIYAAIRTQSDGAVYFLYTGFPVYVYADNLHILRPAVFRTLQFSLAGALLISMLLSALISRPLVRLSREARKLKSGDYSATFSGNGFTEIDELSEVLSGASKELQRTESLRQDVIANVSHDLKTPLTLIKSYAELLIDFPDAPNEKRRQRLELILSETDKMTGLVNDMLRIAQAEGGYLRLEKKVFDLSALVREVMNAFSVFADMGYRFSITVEDGLNVYADKKQIMQVLYNYISNSINYTGKNKDVRIELGRLNDAARFDVFDSGNGISDEDKEHIWDRYFRASEHYTRSAGTGLGLSIVKHILDAHEAKYGVNSIVGKGSNFYFELPLTEDAAAQIVEAAGENAKPEPDDAEAE